MTQVPGHRGLWPKDTNPRAKQNLPNVGPTVTQPPLGLWPKKIHHRYTQQLPNLGLTATRCRYIGNSAG